MDDLINLLKVKQNEILMMVDRNVELTDEQAFILHIKSLKDLIYSENNANSKNSKFLLKTMDAVNLRIKWKNTNIYHHESDNEYTLIGYSDVYDQKTNKEDLIKFEQQLVDFTGHRKLKRSIYISTVSLGSGAKELATTLSSNYFTQFFNENELYYNPTKHRMYQTHYALSIKEKVKILKELSISINQIPQIITADQIVKWFGWFEGTVVRITRLDPPNNQYYDYRLVVNRDWTD